MQEFRRFVRGPMGKVLLIAIIVPFVISGFYGYFTGGANRDVVAEVDGNNIGRSYVNARVDQLRNLLRQQSPDLDPSMLDAFVRPEMVLQSVINEQLVLLAGENAGMAFSETQVAREIYNSPLFMENGEFSELAFERETRRRGMTPQSYVRGLQQDLMSRQYQDGFVLSEFALPIELAEQRRLGEQRRDISFTVLDVNALAQTMALTDSELRQYYEDNADRFMQPEQFRIAFLELNAENYAANVDVSEDDIKREYQARKAIAEQRHQGAAAQRVAHIMLEISGNRNRDQALDLADEVLARLRAGESFAALAAEFSDDSGSANQGGDLGVLTPGTLPSELESAVAQLSSGEFSSPVESDAGVHIMTVNTERREMEWASLDEMRAEIERDLINAQAEALLFEDATLLEELVFQHNDLQQPAEDMNLSVQRTDWVSLDDLPEPLAHRQVSEALQHPDVLEEGHNSDLIELSAGRYLAVRIEDRQDASRLPFDVVEAQVREQLAMARAVERVAQIRQQAEEMRASGNDLNAFASLFEASVREERALERGQRRPSAALVNAAFRAAGPGSSGEAPVVLVELENGSLAAFNVTAITPGDESTLTASQQRTALEQLAVRYGEQQFRTVLAHLRSNAKVRTYPERLQRQ